MAKFGLSFQYLYLSKWIYEAWQRHRLKGRRDKIKSFLFWYNSHYSLLLLCPGLGIDRLFSLSCMNGQQKPINDLILTSHDKGTPRSWLILKPIQGIVPQAAIILNGCMMLLYLKSINMCVEVNVGFSYKTGTVDLVPAVTFISCVSSLS